MNATFATGHIDEPMLLTVAQSFVGDIEQMHPSYSAIKIDGSAAYIAARKGEEVVMKARMLH